MQLQVNDAGSWRKVINFNAAADISIREAACIIMDTGSAKAMRIVDDGIVVAHCKRDSGTGASEWVTA